MSDNLDKFRVQTNLASSYTFLLRQQYATTDSLTLTKKKRIYQSPYRKMARASFDSQGLIPTLSIYNISYHAYIRGDIIRNIKTRAITVHRRVIGVTITESHHSSSMLCQSSILILRFTETKI